MSSFVERAALHQSRFRTPGVGPDTRGVVLGQKGILLFPSLDRAVAFFRALGDGGTLAELIPSLAIRRVVTPLRTREIVVSLAAESSYRMDRVAEIGRLAGGLAFTGTSRHFVRYRDAHAPLGYDVSQLADQAADLILYDSAFQQTYTFERELPLRELVLKLQPQRVPPADEGSLSRLFAVAEIGVGHALIGYLFRWRVRARAALAEWPAGSAFDEGPRRAHLFTLEECPQRVVDLLRRLPGVRVYSPIGERLGVELGFRHPIALDACDALFPPGALYLFAGDGTVTSVEPAPSFVPVRSLVRTSLEVAEGPALVRAATSRELERAITLPMRLAPSAIPFRAIHATIVPTSERAWLARLLYLVPQRTLESLRVATTPEAVYLIDPAGVEGVPIGRFFAEIAPRVYVPAGTALVPAVAPAVLEELLRERGSGHVFFEPGVEDPATPIPRVVPDEAFGAVSRRLLRDVGALLAHADAPDRVDPTLPLVQYGASRRFPLWGVPGAGEE